MFTRELTLTRPQNNTIRPGTVPVPSRQKHVNGTAQISVNKGIAANPSHTSRKNANKLPCVRVRARLTTIQSNTKTHLSRVGVCQTIGTLGRIGFFI
jgi:hypothetical protein